MLHARMSSVADYSITKSQIDDLMILTMMTIKQQTDETPAGSYVRYIKNAHSSTASSSSSSSTMYDTYALGTQVRRLFVNRVVQQLGPIPYTVCTTITHRERICCSRRAFSHSTHTRNARKRLETLELQTKIWYLCLRTSSWIDCRPAASGPRLLSASRNLSMVGCSAGEEPSRNAIPHMIRNP